MRNFVITALMVLMFATPVLAQEADLYTCPMHPHITSDEPGTCPICGMDLTPMEKETVLEDKAGTSINTATLQAMNVQTTHAHKMALGQEVRGYGKITQNLENRYTLSTRADGWIETMSIHGVGKKVSKGDLLLTLYSPELLAAQKDYLSAVTLGNPSRKKATKHRLMALGMQEKAIKEMVSKNTAFQDVPFYAPLDGYVTAIHAHNGAAVKSGAPLMVLDDLSSLWVDVAISADDVIHLNGSTTATLKVADTGQARTAKLQLIHPVIDTATRTGGARLEFANPDGSLKPGQYADVLFETDVKQRLVVPESALLHGKDGYRVIVAAGDGYFYPQNVETGVRADGMVEVTSGLRPHTAIVSNGQFLIDADSNLKNAGTHMGDGQKEDDMNTGGGHGGH